MGPADFWVAEAGTALCVIYVDGGDDWGFCRAFEQRQEGVQLKLLEGSDEFILEKSIVPVLKYHDFSEVAARSDVRSSESGSGSDEVRSIHTTHTTDAHAHTRTRAISTSSTSNQQSANSNQQLAILAQTTATATAPHGTKTNPTAYGNSCAAASAQRARSEQVAVCNATEQDDQTVRDAAPAISCRTRRAERTRGYVWTQTARSRRPPNASEMHQATAATTPWEAVSRAEAALKAAEMAGLAEDIITNQKREISRRREEQLKQRSVGKQLDAAKTALTQAATLVTKRNQEVAESRSGEGNAPDRVSVISKMCIADSQHEPNPERRGRRCDNSDRCGRSVIDGRMGVILRLTKTLQSALTAEEEAGMQQAQTSSCGAAGENAKQLKRTTTLRTTGRRHGEHTVETNTTRGSVKRKYCTPRATRR